MYKYLLTLVFLLISANCSNNINEFNLEYAVLQVHPFQRHLYKNVDYLSMMKVVGDNLKDLGFDIKTFDADVGVIYAEAHKLPKTEKLDYNPQLLARHMDDNFTYYWGAVVNIDDLLNTNMDIKLELFRKTVNDKGEEIKMLKIEDHRFYSIFFEKLEKDLLLIR